MSRYRDLGVRYDQPDDFTVETLKVMNATSWRLLAAVLGGADAGAGPPDDDDRATAAKIVEKACDLLVAEMIDNLRAMFGHGIVPGDVSTGEGMFTLRENLQHQRKSAETGRTIRTTIDEAKASTAKVTDPEKLAAGKEIMERMEVVAGEFEKLDPATIRAVQETQQASIYAWVVLAFYRAHPDRRLSPGEFAACEAESVG